MFDDIFNDKDLIQLVVESFSEEEVVTPETLHDRMRRITVALSICTFVQLMFRINGFDDDLFQVVRGQMSQFIMRTADMQYIQEFSELNEHLFSRDSNDLMLGLQKLFAVDDGPEAFQKALESLDLWEDQMKQLYFLHLNSVNDLPI